MAVIFNRCRTVKGTSGFIASLSRDRPRSHRWIPGLRGRADALLRTGFTPGA